MGICAPLAAVSRLPTRPVWGFGRDVDEGTGVSVLPQDFGEMVFFLMR